MALIVLYDTQKGVTRLLAQPGYFLPAPVTAPVELRDATPEHQTLYREYVADLKIAYGIAADWWAGTVEAQEALGKSREEAVETAFNDRVAGAAAHPRIVWLIRRYWLYCTGLNRTKVTRQFVSPEIFLLQWLIDDGEDDLVQLIACMPYWPIGLDEDGNWC